MSANEIAKYLVRVPIVVGVLQNGRMFSSAKSCSYMSTGGQTTDGFIYGISGYYPDYIFLTQRTTTRNSEFNVIVVPKSEENRRVLCAPSRSDIIMDVSLQEAQQHLVKKEISVDEANEEIRKYQRLSAIIEQKKKAELQYIPQQKKTRGSAPNPVVIKGIQGNTSSSVPNDNDIAVSNNGTVVSVVNSNMSVYNDTGKLLVNKRSLTSMTAAVGNYTWISDPRVIYDPNNDRFILICFHIEFLQIFFFW
jgi:hypothetical protein